MGTIGNILVFDSETDTHNKGHAYDPRNICVAYATFCPSIGESFRYYTDPDFTEFITKQLQGSSVLVGHNIKFDIHWLANLGVGISGHVKIWDTQIAQHILEGQSRPMLSLDDCLDIWELPKKEKDIVHEYWEAGVQTRDIPVDVLKAYNLRDIDVTYQLFRTQYEAMSEKQRNLVFVEGEDLLTLQAAERAGIKFNVQQAKQEITKLQAEVAGLESSLGARLPAGIPDNCWNWDSGDHLSCFLYGGSLTFRYVKDQTTFKTGAKAGMPKNIWGEVTVDFPRMFTPLRDSELKKSKDHSDPKAPSFWSTDQTILSQLKATSKAKLEILEQIKSRGKKIKVVEMIESILALFESKQWQDDLIHGQFNQTVAITGRLSSSSPNGQNYPPEVDNLLVSRYND